jgi:hypothetical protein
MMLGGEHDTCSRSVVVAPERGLATALAQAGQRGGAVNRLETCAADQPYLLDTGFFGPAQWMQTRLQLADLYRETGALDRARAIEDDLRRLLAVADSDHPILVRLNDRQ